MSSDIPLTNAFKSGMAMRKKADSKMPEVNSIPEELLMKMAKNKTHKQAFRKNIGGQTMAFGKGEGLRFKAGQNKKDTINEALN